MSYIVIVDMDQPGSRFFIGLQENEYEMAEFATHADILELKAKHSLRVFEWIVIGVREHTGTEIF